MKYQEVKPGTKADWERQLASENPGEVIEGLLSAAFYSSDWRWIQNHCLIRLAHSDPAIRRVAAQCLGHIARIHRTLDVEKVIPLLESLRDVPETAAAAEDALDDIRQFLANKG